jgi:hypothetical protein
MRLQIENWNYNRKFLGYEWNLLERTEVDMLMELLLWSSRRQALITIDVLYIT